MPHANIVDEKQQIFACFFGDSKKRRKYLRKIIKKEYRIEKKAYKMQVD